MPDIELKKQDNITITISLKEGFFFSPLSELIFTKASPNNTIIRHSYPFVFSDYKTPTENFIQKAYINIINELNSIIKNSDSPHRLIDPIYFDAIIYNIVTPLNDEKPSVCYIKFNEEIIRLNDNLLSKTKGFLKGDAVEIGLKFGNIIDIRPKGQNTNI